MFPKRRNNVSTSEDVDIKLHFTKWESYLLLFWMQLGLVCTKISRFVEYTPKKYFNSFLQSAVDAGRPSNGNPNPSVVARTMKLLFNKTYGYQIIDCSQHTLKSLSDKKIYAAINSKLFKRLGHASNSLY